MKFKTFQLIIDGNYLKRVDVEKICSQYNTTFTHNLELFEIETQLLEDRFLWMTCQYDNAVLYNDHVWNSESLKKKTIRAKNRKLNAESSCLFVMILKNVFCI